MWFNLCLELHDMPNNIRAKVKGVTLLAASHKDYLFRLIVRKSWARRSSLTMPGGQQSEAKQITHAMYDRRNLRATNNESQNNTGFRSHDGARTCVGCMHRLVL
jgi:hypothetical protein